MYNQNQKPALLEVFTPTKDNDVILLNYFKALN
jgi:2-succinyl-5-enolpyruvyl-6-hydroxy-3-cyclohexene-1-carboxylate synthase